MIGDAGNNYISVAPGANYALTRAKIDEAMPIIDQAAVIILQYEILADTIEHVIDLAHDKGIPVQWNFAPARDFDMSYLGKTDTLIVNEIEAEFLSGVKITDAASAESSAKVLLGKGSESVIITLGSEGAMAFQGDRICSVPAFEVEAVDTTSAGDVFCGSFAVAMMEDKALEDSLRFANAAAALCVTRMGAQPSAPTRREIDAFLAEH
jgi:ribokinase